MQECKSINLHRMFYTWNYNEFAAVMKEEKGIKN